MFVILNIFLVSSFTYFILTIYILNLSNFVLGTISTNVTYRRNKILLCVVPDKSQLLRIVPTIEEARNKYKSKEQKQAGRQE